MNRALLLAFILAACGLPLRAIENINDSAHPKTDAPGDSDISHWSTGWGTQNDANGITGWDYVGSIGGATGASGIYLGNGWVLTAGHVGVNDFTLGTTTYTYDPASIHTITSGGNTPDLVLFQVFSPPNLPSLSLRLTDPVAFSDVNPGSAVAMIGYGAGDLGRVKSWGINHVTQVNQPITLDGYPYVSTDFLTIDNSYTAFIASNINDYRLAVGDSGGADFIFNSVTGKWELAGLNEATGSGTINSQNVTFSAMVQLNTYRSQIQGIIATPEPSAGLLVAVGLVVLAVCARRRSFL